jgi:hypothetical protein
MIGYLALDRRAVELADYIRKHPLPDGLRPDLESRVRVLTGGRLNEHDIIELTTLVRGKLEG